MLASLKVLFLMSAVLGVAATGAAGVNADAPMSKAIDIHEDHLGADTTLPDQAIKGQQTAYDHLMKNLEKWIAKNHTWMPGDHGNSSDDMDDDD